MKRNPIDKIAGTLHSMGLSRYALGQGRDTVLCLQDSHIFWQESIKREEIPAPDTLESWHARTLERNVQDSCPRTQDITIIPMCTRRRIWNIEHFINLQTHGTHLLS